MLRIKRITNFDTLEDGRKVLEGEPPGFKTPYQYSRDFPPESAASILK